jgi:dihydropyrimidinase
VQFELVVRGGTVVTASDVFIADVGVSGGQIVAIAKDLPTAPLDIDARGLQVLPGGVDVHTHLDATLGEMTSVDDFESGTAAAACGGITTICDYACQRQTR